MCYWLGYDVDYKGCKLLFILSGLGFKRFFVDFNNIMFWKLCVDLIMLWLKNFDLLMFVMLYFDFLDEVGYCCGLDLVNVMEEIRKDDEIIGYLL